MANHHSFGHSVERAGFAEKTQVRCHICRIARVLVTPEQEPICYACNEHRALRRVTKGARDEAVCDILLTVLLMRAARNE
jgi:hypothetical protein